MLMPMRHRQHSSSSSASSFTLLLFRCKCKHQAPSSKESREAQRSRHGNRSPAASAALNTHLSRTACSGGRGLRHSDGETTHRLLGEAAAGGQRRLQDCAARTRTSNSRRMQGGAEGRSRIRAPHATHCGRAPEGSAEVGERFAAAEAAEIGGHAANSEDVFFSA